MRPDERWRARIAVRIALGVAPWGTLFAAVFGLLGHTLVSASIALSVVALLAGRFLIPRLGLQAAGHVLTAGFVQALVVPAWFTGGLLSAGLPWIALCIALAYIVAGARAGMLWTVIALFAIVGLYALDGSLPPPAVDAEQHLLLTVLTVAGLTTVVAVIMGLAVHGVAVQQEELERARLAAQQANLAKSSFLARMSHELRTPMNAMLGYTELLREEATASTDADLARIETSGRQLLGLVNDILDLSKVEAGEMTFTLRPCDARELLVQATDQVRPLLEAQGNTLELHTSPAICIADEQRLHQCLLNLLSNANKFTTRGTLQASVQRDGRHVVVEVRDDGIGMTPEQAERVFDPFVQVHGTPGRGTGLGLAIVKQFVDRMDGDITVESAIDHGSAFRLVLPAA